MKRLLVPLALVALAAAVGAAGWFAAVAPERAHVRRLDRQADGLQGQLLAYEAARAASHGAGATQLYQLARAMPAGDDTTGLLLELDRLARATGVTLQQVRPGARVTLASGSAVLPVSAVVQGRYAQVAAFLRRLRLEVRGGGDHVVAEGRLWATDSVGLAAGDPQSPQAVTATLQLGAFEYGAGESGSWTVATTTTPTTTATTPSGAVAAGATG